MGKVLLSVFFLFTSYGKKVYIYPCLQFIVKLYNSQTISYNDVYCIKRIFNMHSFTIFKKMLVS